MIFHCKWISFEQEKKEKRKRKNLFVGVILSSFVQEYSFQEEKKISNDFSLFKFGWKFFIDRKIISEIFPKSLFISFHFISFVVGVIQNDDDDDDINHKSFSVSLPFNITQNQKRKKEKKMILMMKMILMNFDSSKLWYLSSHDYCGNSEMVLKKMKIIKFFNGKNFSTHKRYMIIIFCFKLSFGKIIYFTLKCFFFVLDLHIFTENLFPFHTMIIDWNFRFCFSFLHFSFCCCFLNKEF